MYGNKKHLIGFIGEKTALVWLIFKGYKVLACNKRQRAEVDILARKTHNIILCEVKTRTNTRYIHASISQAQRRRLRAQMQLVAAQYPQYTVQCDALFIQLKWPIIQHVENILAQVG